MKILTSVLFILPYIDKSILPVPNLFWPECQFFCYGIFSSCKVAYHFVPVSVLIMGKVITCLRVLGKT